MTYASVAASAEPVNETDQEFRAIYLKALDDAIPNNMGQLMIRGHSHSPVPFAGRHPFWTASFSDMYWSFHNLGDVTAFKKGPNQGRAFRHSF